MAILEILLISPEQCEVNIFTDSEASIQTIDKIKKNRARDWSKKNNIAILKGLKQAIETKNIKVRMHKVKAYSGVRKNEIADSEAKKGQRSQK